MKKDKQILEVLTSFGVATREDLGTDFGSGNGTVPDIDSDLEEECNPKGLKYSDVKNSVKDGVDFKPRGEFEEAELGSGDQAMNFNAGVINNSIPDSYKPSK